MKLGPCLLFSGQLRVEESFSEAENTKNIYLDGESGDDEDTEEEEEEVWKMATRTEAREEKEEEKSTAPSEETKVKQIELNEELSNEIVVEKHLKPGKETECEDKFKNCQVVVQSRLCRYSFYQSNCCQSCSYLRL